MQKNFTKLITRVFRSKKITVPAAAVLLFLATSLYVWAAVGVTVTGGGTFPVSADLAANATLSTPAYTPLGAIEILENADGDFAVTSSGSLILTAPVGWTFKRSGVTAAVVNGLPTGNSGTNVTVDNSKVGYSASTITIPFAVDKTNQRDKITISGVEVQALNGANVPGTGSISISVAGGTVVAGLPKTVSKALSQTYGAARKIAFGVQPTNTPTNNSITPAPTVLVQDQFGNTVTSGTGSVASVTMAIGTNPTGSNGVLSGTKTVTAVNGIAAFSALNIDAAGTSYTLAASTASFGSATSNTFNITSKTPTLNAPTACVSEGDAETTIPLTGTNFEKNSIVRVNGNSKTTTFTSATQVSVTLLASDLITAGNLALTVLNPGPPANNVSNSQNLNIKPLLKATDIVGEREVCAGNQAVYQFPSGFHNFTVSLSEGATLVSNTAGQAVVNFGTAPTSGTVRITVSALNECNVSSTAFIDVTVKPTPPAVIEYDSRSFCAGGSLELRAFVDPANTDNYNYKWFKLGANDVYNLVGENQPTYTATTAGTYRLTVTGTNTCSQTSDPVDITVDPLPTVSIDALNDDYCSSDAAVTLTGQPVGGSFRILKNNVEVASGASLAPASLGAGNYVIEYSYTNENGCTNTATKAVTVKQQPTVSLTSDLAICPGESATLTAGGADSYRWSPATGLDATTGASVIAKPTVTTTYTVIGSSNGCESEAKTVTVTVNPLPDVTITPTGPTEFCSGNYVDLVAKDDPSYNYEWFKTGNSASIGGESSLRVDKETGTGSYYVTITTNAGCTLPSETIAVKVADVPEVATITTTGATTFCQTGSVRFDANKPPVGQTYVYQWEVSADGVNFNPVATNGEANFYIANASGYYRVLVSNTREANEDIELCVKTSEAVQVVVLPQPAASITSGNQALCRAESGATTFTVSGTFSGGTATWSSANANFVISNRTDVVNTETGVTTSTVTVSVSGTSTTTVSSNITLRTSNSAATCSPASSSIALSVKPLPEATITANGPTTFCENGSVRLTASAGTSWLWSTGATTQFIDVTQSGDYTVRVTNSNDCAVTSAPTVVTVNELPEVAISTVFNAVYCQSEPSVALQGSPVNGTFRILNGATVVVNNATQFDPAALAAGTYTVEYTYTADNDCPNTATKTVVVNPTPTVNAISNKTYCNSLSGAAINFGSPVSGATYAWTSTADVGFGTKGNGNIAAYTATNTGTAPVTATVRVIATANSCQGPEQSFTITVNPTPQINNIPTNAAICSGSTFSYTPTSATANANFSWTRLAANGITSSGGTTGTGPVNQTLTNSGTAPVNVTYSYTTTANTCAGTTQDVVVTVNPTPKLSSSLSPAAVCSGSAFNYTATSATTGTTFSWSRAAVNGISNTAVSNVSGNVINETLLNTTASPINVVYAVTMASNTCTNTQNVIVAVSPNLPVSLTGTIANTSTFYTGQSTVALSATPTGGTFSGLGVSGSVSAGFTFNPCAAGAGTHTITYTRTTGTCTSTVQKTVTVKQSVYRAVITANPFPFCQGDKSIFTTTIYRDFAPGDIIYPYLVNDNGEPIDRNGNLIDKGQGTFPVANDKYPFPPNTPDAVKALAYRFFLPIVKTGTATVSSSNFDYQWTKNDKNDRKTNTSEIGDAGLSSQDYYSVNASSLNPLCNLSLTLSANRVYSAEMANYAVSLASNAICSTGDGNITLTATLGVGFPWDVSDLKLEFVLSRTNTVLGTATYANATSNVITLVVNATTARLINGDQVYVRFSTNIDPYLASTKCGGTHTSNNASITINEPAAIAAALTSNTVCAGTASTTFTVQATGTNLQYAWYKGTPSGAHSQITNQAGKYNISTTNGSLTISNVVAADENSYYVVVSNSSTAACAATATSTVAQLRVTPLPVQYSMTGGGAYCASDITGVAIGLSNSQTGVNYQLYNGTNPVGNPVAGTGSALSFPNQTAVGTYTVMATTVAAQGATAACPQTMTGNAIVTVNPLPTVTVNSPTTCTGVFATITAVPSGGSGTYTTYTWTNLPAGVTNPGNVASFQTTVAGNYTVSVTDNKACASSATATSTVTVNPLPTVSVNSSTVCQGTFATITATPAGGTAPYTYTWTDLPAGVTNPGNVASFQTTVAGNYTVRVADNNACASSATATGTVTVNPKVVATGDLTATDGEGNVVEPEVGKSVTYVATTNIGTNNNEVESYRWYRSSDGITWEQQSSSTNQLVISPVPDGPFYLQVQIAPIATGCYTTNQLLLETGKITPFPVEIIYLNASRQGNSVLLEWATASEQNNQGFEVQVSEDGASYRKLDFVPSKNSNSSTKQVYTFLDKESGKFGTRYYRLKQLDTDGTTEFFGPKAVNFGSVASKVIAFPNPFHDEVTLDIAAEADGEALIVVTDAVGKKLLERKVAVSKGFTTEKLNLSTNLPKGLYIIRTQVGDYTQYIKMIKE